MSTAQQETAATPASSPDVQQPHAAASRTAGLLMDLKLDARVRFGKTDLRLKEILKLASGSVVELDRGPNDLVELIVNGRVIARCEVLVVDGCYGMRITEIVKSGDGQAGAMSSDIANLVKNLA